jgi:transposase-like protein
MDFQRTYSLVEVADRLGKARTTLSDWARQFKEFLPTVGSGRSMRYTEAAIEVFGLISKMKDSNEPPEYIREQLRHMVHEIIVPMTGDDDDGKPYLMQITDEVDQLKQAVVMLAQRLETITTENDETRRQIAATTEQLSGQIVNVSDILKDEIRKGQEQTSAQMREILSRVETYGKRKRGLFNWFKKS